jgi:hypothetical protein
MPASAPPAPEPPAAVAAEVKPPEVPIVRPPQTVSPKQREAARVIAKPRPARRGSDTEVAKPLPPRATGGHNSKLPFSDASFDDSDNSGNNPNSAPNREKVKTTPIVTEFGN